MGKILYSLILTLIIGSSFAQRKEIEIKFDKKHLKNKISAFTKIDEIGPDARNIYIDEIASKKISISYFRQDTLIIQIWRYIPIVIEGIQKIKSDTLIIKNIPMIKYIPIDSMTQYSIEYSKKDSLSHKEKTKISTPYNSLKKIKETESITINNKVYTLNLFSEVYENEVWACTPGKVGYNNRIKGVKKYYILKL